MKKKKRLRREAKKAERKRKRELPHATKQEPEPFSAKQIGRRSRTVDRLFRIAMGHMLAVERKKRGLTQMAVANGIRRPQSFISKTERGERRIEMIDLVELTAVMDIDVTEFTARIRTKWDKRE